MYADGVDNVSLSGGMIRMDLYHIDGCPDANSKALPRVVDTQIVMPPAAFMRAFESLQQFVAELEKKGIVHHISPVHDHTHHVSSSPNFD